jgi:hypothetical protein
MQEGAKPDTSFIYILLSEEPDPQHCLDLRQLLKGHYQEKVVEIIPINHRIGLN